MDLMGFHSKQRTVEPCIELPEEVIEVRPIATFKKQLNRHIDIRGLDEYELIGIRVDGTC